MKTLILIIYLLFILAGLIVCFTEHGLHAGLFVLIVSSLLFIIIAKTQ
jgi:hypothetical protein